MYNFYYLYLLSNYNLLIRPTSLNVIMAPKKSDSEKYLIIKQLANITYSGNTTRMSQ